MLPTVKIADIIDKQEWGINNLDFDKGKDGKIEQMITISGTDYVKFTILTAVVTGGFKLAPNTLIWSKDLSAAGGIFESHKDVIKTSDRSITKADIHALNDISYLSCIKVLAEGFGIKYKFPAAP